MSDSRDSWGEFSDLLHDEEYDGRRLAEFLQKKKGGTQPPLRPVFDGYEPEKCSLKVNLKRLSPRKTPPPLPSTVTSSPVQQSELDNANVNGGETVANGKMVTAAELQALEEEHDPPVVNAPRSPMTSAPTSPSRRPMLLQSGSVGRVTPSDQLRRQTLIRRSALSGVNRALLSDFESTLTDQSFLPPVHSTPISLEGPRGHANSPIKEPIPELSATKHTAVDMNLSSNTMSCDQLKCVSTHSTFQRLALRNCSNDPNPVPAAQPHSPSVHDDASLHKRSYFVKEGVLPGQVILTPRSSPRRDTRSVPVTPSAAARLSQTISVISPQKLNRSWSVPNTPSAQHHTSAAVQSDQMEIPETQELLQATQNLVQSTPIVNIPVNVYQTFNAGPPGNSTQVNCTAPSSNTIAKEQGTPVVEAFNTPTKEQSIQQTEIAATPIQDKKKESRLASVNESERHASPVPIDEAELQLSDIMTDDSDTEISPAPRNCRTTRQQLLPLNLAASRSKKAQATRSKRLVKRSTMRRTRQHDYSPSTLSETENEVGPPRAHPLLVRRASQLPSGDERRRVLNKAPNTPINGEKFAAELARLTNGEILDLRKRNSLGKLFAISGRKSSGGGRVHCAQQQQEADQLERQLVAEIAKRNLQDVEMVDDNDSVIIEDELLLSILSVPLPPAPQQFQDTIERSIARETTAVATRTTAAETAEETAAVATRKTAAETAEETTAVVVSKVASTASAATEAETAEDIAAVAEAPTAEPLLPLPAEDCSESVLLNTNSSLIDRISYRVTIINASQRSQTNVGKQDVKHKKDMPEATKNYINVKKQMRKHRRKSTSSSMRSLYSRGDSIESCEMRSSGRLSLEQAEPLSKRTPSLSTELRIVSPPPPMNESLTRRRQPARLSKEANREVLPPPTAFSNQAFESTSGVSNDASTSAAATKAVKDTSAATDATCFKKPQMPAPKTRRQRARQRAEKPVSQTLELSTSDAAEANSSNLRRSKRSHTQPAGNNLIQTMYQSIMDQKKLRAHRKNITSSISACAGLPIASSTTTSARGSVCHENRVKKRSHSRATKAAAASLAAHAPAASLLGDTDTSSYTSLTEVVVGGGRDGATAGDECRPTLRVPPRAHLELPTIVEPYSESAEQAEEAEAHESRRVLGLEHSRIRMNPTPVNQLNDIFDELKRGADAPTAASQPSPTKSVEVSAGDTATSAASSAKSAKKLRVRLKRISRDNQGSASATSSGANTTVICSSRGGNAEASTQGGGSHASVELLAWLKGISDMQLTSDSNKVFKQMRFSPAGKLIFADLEGIDYAFYDTDNVGSMGYLRFKPRQTKPSKRTKKYDLHFVVLSGEFTIDSNSESGTFSTGDMVVIKKGSRYVIKNATDDVGLLMVVKR